MKKITVLLALTLVLIFSAQENANAGHVHVNVRWGMLWGCAVSGMCSVDIDVEWLTVMTYTGSTNGQGGTLVINASKKEIDGDKLKFFEGDQFEFSGDMKIPSDVSQQLGMEDGSIIAKGKYQLKDAGDVYIITIPIK